MVKGCPRDAFTMTCRASFSIASPASVMGLRSASSVSKGSNGRRRIRAQRWKKVMPRSLRMVASISGKAAPTKAMGNSSRRVICCTAAVSSLASGSCRPCSSSTVSSRPIPLGASRSATAVRTPRRSGRSPLLATGRSSQETPRPRTCTEDIRRAGLPASISYRCSHAAALILDGRSDTEADTEMTRQPRARAASSASFSSTVLPDPRGPVISNV